MGQDEEMIHEKIKLFATIDKDNGENTQVCKKVVVTWHQLGEVPLLTDQVEKKNISIEYCPTDEMWADYMTKPLQGEKFIKFRDEILGITRRK